MFTIAAARNVTSKLIVCLQCDASLGDLWHAECAPRLLGSSGYEVHISSERLAPSGHRRAGGDKFFFNLGTLAVVCKLNKSSQGKKNKCLLGLCLLSLITCKVLGLL